MGIEKIISELWEYVYNKYSTNGVLIISRERFEEEMLLLRRRNKDAQQKESEVKE